MPNPFYVALGDHDGSLQEAARRGLEPFRHYLQNSITALKDKEATCSWSALDSAQWRVSVDEQAFRIMPFSELELFPPQPGWYEITRDLEDDAPVDDCFEYDVADPVVIGKGHDRRRIELSDSDVSLRDGRVRVRLGIDLNLDRITWCGYTLAVRSLNVELEDTLRLESGGRYFDAVRQSGNAYRINAALKSGTELLCDGQNLEYRFIRAFDPSCLEGLGVLLRDDGQGYLLFTKKKPKSILAEIRDETPAWLASLGPSHFLSDGESLSDQHWTCDVVKDKGISYLQLTARDQSQKPLCGRLSLLTYPDLSVSCVKIESQEKWIQLIEDEEVLEQAGRSALDSFFDDQARIQDAGSKGAKDEGYRIIKARPDERQLLLGSPKKYDRSIYPASGRLTVKVDTHQLEQQKYAVQNLQARPILEHSALVNLFTHRDQMRWNDVDTSVEADIQWRILKDDGFEGCDRQREFVAKALNTPDFAILDGPPGTGKTTTILELIVQLVRRGQRVLLSASTHAAINNVLERILGDESLSSEVFPLRIGDENRAVGVEELQYERQLESLRNDIGINVSEQLLLDSSNLVCGTTIGILRLFRNRNLALDTGEAPFDVLIVDECSKTTFQEFLVPARYARRWILVGDERQLSPFADREQITANLERLMLGPPRGKSPPTLLDHDVQLACFYLHEFDSRTDKFLIPVSPGVLRALAAELQHREGKSCNQVLLVGLETLGSGQQGAIASIDHVRRDPSLLYSHNLVFVVEALRGTLEDFLPDDMIVLAADWEETSHAFRHRVECVDKHAYKFRGREALSDGFEIHQKVMDRLEKTSWAEEVSWRLEREYWLRFGKGHKGNSVTRQLERLLPKSVQADGRIYTLRNIAFPSVLEALSGSGLEKRRKDEPTTLNQGFTSKEREQRHSTLSHQHRMHPEISRFPREHFYNDDRRNRSLLDGGGLMRNRQWSYDAYPSRSHWLHVHGKVSRNQNEKEVQAVIAALQRFCQWAETQQQVFEAAVLTFYKGQERALREALQKLTGMSKAYSRFCYKGVSVKLATVDFFQGQEADLVLLSMVNNLRDGFMDSPNRLNVSVTRARYQLVIVGDWRYFAQKSPTKELNSLAKACTYEGTHE